MQLLSWPERLAIQLKRLVDEAIAAQIMEGSEDLKTAEETTEWVRQAVDKLDRLVPDPEIRKRILTGCACPFPSDRIEKLRDYYRQCQDIDSLLDKMYRNAFYNRPERKDNTIYITKVPSRPEEYAQATTPEEKRLYYCHCSQVRGSGKRVSPTFCYCGAGWCRNIFEQVLERPVDVEVCKCVLQDDDDCIIAVRI